MSRRQQTCPTCFGPRRYFDDFDMYGCTACDTWLERVCTCGGEACAHFKMPPAKPSMVARTGSGPGEQR